MKSDASTAVTIIRVYDHEATPPPGAYLVLVDRLWPRGVRKDSLDLDDWCRDVTPSPQLRKWYGHDPEKYPTFRDRYRAELREEPAAPALASIAAHLGEGSVVLYTAVKDVDISAAAVLREILDGTAPLS